MVTFYHIQRRQCKIMFEQGTLKLGDISGVQEFCKQFLVSEKLVTNYLEHLTELKLKKTLRKQKKQKPEERNTNQDEDLDRQTDSDEEENVIINEIDGSDTDSDSDTEDLPVYVPPMRTVTRHGRLAGTWQRNFGDGDNVKSDSDNSDGDSSSEDNDESNDIDSSVNNESNDPSCVRTRSGRKAGSWRSYKYL